MKRITQCGVSWNHLQSMCASTIRQRWVTERRDTSCWSVCMSRSDSLYCWHWITKNNWMYEPYWPTTLKLWICFLIMWNEVLATWMFIPASCCFACNYKQTDKQKTCLQRETHFYIIGFDLTNMQLLLAFQMDERRILSCHRVSPKLFTRHP